MRELLLRSSEVSSNRVPSSTGMLPSRLWLARASPVIRLGVPPVVTPVQLEMAVPAAQFRVAVPLRASLAESNAWQSCTSPRFTAGLVTAVPVAQVIPGGGWPGVKVAVLPSSGVMSP